jgi:ribose/xylose/arabinose/galactoside ABC-type transport system permease subunit
VTQEKIKESVIRNINENRIFLFVLLIFIFMSAYSKAFITPYNLKNLIKDISVPGILACSVLMLIVSGHFDLSVGAVLALAGAISAQLSVNGFSLSVVFLITILFGALVGLINGVMVCYLKVNSLIATLSMMFILRGILLVFTGGFHIYGMSDSYLWFGHSSVGPLPIQFFILIVIAIFIHLFLHKSVMGRHLYVIGSSKKSAFLSGINVNSNVTIIFIIVGVLSAFAGIIYSAYYTAASSIAAMGMEITVIASIIVGGANLLGGKGTVIRTIAGVLLLEIIFNALGLLNANPNYTQIFQGFIIIIAVAIDVLATRKKG